MVPSGGVLSVMAQSAEVGALEAIATQRAVRHLRPDPVPREILTELVFAATRAPSAANRQPWEFIVVTEAEQRQRIGEVYLRASKRLFEYLIGESADDATKRIYRNALHLSDHLAEAPALIVVCTPVSEEWTFASRLPSVYPAVQNLLLAARARGLGAVLTTAHKRREDDLKAVLGIPDEMETVCLIPVGYPRDPDRVFLPVTLRRPIDEVCHWDRF
jgi:nitroreductase